MHSFFKPLIQRVTEDTKKPRERHLEHWLIPTMEPRGEELPSCPAWQEPPHPGTALGTYPGSVLGAASSLRVQAELLAGGAASRHGAGPVQERSDGAKAAPGLLLAPSWALSPADEGHAGGADRAGDPSTLCHRLSCGNLRPPA